MFGSLVLVYIQIYDIHYFEIAMQLRESLFLNGILFNTEAWHGLKEVDYKDLEELDEVLRRDILKAHQPGILLRKKFLVVRLET